ncbi:MAG: GntR family transcriptional regulator [Opitutus sp.]|nr:GntR family transcriptional regulator [Opitutus sp.]
MKDVNSDVAYDHIRRRILTGEYAPGRALMTNELSNEIGVSRTPVRDALRQLEADGLVVIRARLGARVKTMDIKEFREMCGLRMALEAYVAGLAAQLRTESDLHEIRFALENMRRLTALILKSEDEQPFLGELVREDVRFHIAVMTAAKNDLLKEEILRLHLINRVVSGLTPGGQAATMEKIDRNRRRTVVLKEHEAICQAVERGDGPAAKEAMERHIQDIIDTHILLMGRAANHVLARELTEDELSYTA